MKLNINLMKLIIQLSILFIIIVMFFIISMFLYSAKYWPDVYNYINANITIKRIPKISQIDANITIYESTEIYETTDFDDLIDVTTEYYGDNDYFSLEDVESGRRKRRVERGIDYSEVPTREVVVDYVFEDHPERDLVKDLVDENKLTTRHMNDVEILPGIFNGNEYLRITEDCSNGTDIESNIFPWVTAIFIKNGTSNQFDYYCDGALLSETIILTAASCIHKPNASSDDILVILGKRSLRIMTETEIVSKIKEIHIHDNFTGSEHDIAILVMEEVTLSAGAQRARLGGDRGKSATTGWAISGNLTLIQFENEDIDCNEKNIENTFCAVYGNDVSVCPSYGGLYVTNDIDGWFLRGIRNADPTDKGFCVDRSLVYTDLKYYNEWISMFVK